MNIERFKIICLLLSIVFTLASSIIIGYFKPNINDLTLFDIIVISVISVISNALIFIYRFTVSI